MSDRSIRSAKTVQRDAAPELATAVEPCPCRPQADALEIESQAKRRLADEYDAAQARGEIRTRADNSALSGTEKAGWSDIFENPRVIHEARQIRDAELANRLERVSPRAEAHGFAD